MKKTIFRMSGRVFVVAIISFCIMACSHLRENKLSSEDKKFLSAEDIIEKNYTATGGKEAHERIQNVKAEYQISLPTQGMEVDYVYYKERPHKSYSISDLGAMGKIESGSDGKVAWEISPFSGTRVLEGEELATRLLDTVFDVREAWKGLYKSVTTEGVEDVNGRACYKVIMTPEEGLQRIVYYDKETFLMVKTYREAKNQRGTDSIELYMEDYHKTGEILSAHKLTRYVNGQLTDTGVLQSFETNIEMPEGIFDLPEKIKRILQSKDEEPKGYEPLPPITSVARTQASSTFEIDLSPAQWDPAEIEKYNQLEQQFGRENVLFEGKNAIITGTTTPSAQRAGLEALRRGGNAMDAALATSLTNIALSAGAPVSYAGAMELIYYDAGKDQYYSLNAAWNSLFEEDDPMSIPRGSGLNLAGNTNPSGRTALVPGYMAGVEAAHKRFGKLPFSALFTPAIYYAEKGFKVTPSIVGWIFTRQSVLSRLPETKRVFTNKETGYFYGVGDQFYQPELAITLRAVAHQGAAYMYTGEWARRLVALVQRDGGKMTMEDLKNYQAIWSEPLKIPYGDYTIYATGLPAVGGIKIAQALNVAKEAGLSNMGHYAESPEAFFWLFQIDNLSSMTNIPKFRRTYLLKGNDISIEYLATKAHAEKLWEMMSKGQFGMTKAPLSKEPKHSDAILAIDRWGNVAALVHTINTIIWGETGIFVDGVSIADAANWQQQQIREQGPGKRLPDGMEPLIISKNGKPFVALSSVGSGLHQATNSVLFNIMDFNMGLKEAIDAPSLHIPKYIASGVSIPQVYAGDFSNELLAGVKELGLEVEVMPPAGGAPGWVIGAMIDPDGLRKAVPSPRGNGVALGY